MNFPYKTSIDERLIFFTITHCYSDSEYCHPFAIAGGDSIKYQSFIYDARHWCTYSSFTSGDVQQQWWTWWMIWPFSTPNNFVVYGQKNKVWVLIFYVRTSGTSWERILADKVEFSVFQQNHIETSTQFKWRCLVLNVTSSVFMMLLVSPTVMISSSTPTVRTLWTIWAVTCDFQKLWHYDKCRLRGACAASLELWNFK